MQPHIVHACGGVSEEDSDTQWFLYAYQQSGGVSYNFYSSNFPADLTTSSHRLSTSASQPQYEASNIISVSVDSSQSYVLFVSEAGDASLYSLSCDADYLRPAPLQLIGDTSLFGHNESVVTDAVLVSCRELPHFLLPHVMKETYVHTTHDSSDMCVISMSHSKSLSEMQYLTISSYALKLVDGTFSVDLLSTSHITSPISNLKHPKADTTHGSISSGRLRVVHTDIYTSLLMFTAMDQHVFVGALSDHVNTHSEAEREVVAAETLPVVWVDIGVGDKLDVSVSSALHTRGHGTTNSVVMVVSDYGYCYNSHHHNTRSTPVVCSSTPESSKGVLDYSIGLVQDWLDIALSTSDSNNYSSNHITPCHSRIFHGSYDQGHNPSVALSSRYKTLRDGTIGFSAVELHEGLRDSLTPLVNGCGNPIHRDGLVLNSYPFADWINNIIGQDMSVKK